MVSILESGGASAVSVSFLMGLLSSSSSSGIGKGDNSDSRYAPSDFARPESGKNWMYSRSRLASCSPYQVSIDSKYRGGAGVVTNTLAILPLDHNLPRQLKRIL